HRPGGAGADHLAVPVALGVCRGGVDGEYSGAVHRGATGRALGTHAWCVVPGYRHGGGPHRGARVAHVEPVAAQEVGAVRPMTGCFRSSHRWWVGAASATTTHQA